MLKLRDWCLAAIIAIVALPAMGQWEFCDREEWSHNFTHQNCPWSGGGYEPCMNAFACEEVSPGETGRAGCHGRYIVGMMCAHAGQVADGYTLKSGDEHPHFTGGECSSTGSGPDCPDLSDCDLQEGHDPNGGEPIVIKLTRGPWRFSGESDPVLFDLHGHGVTELWTWTARDSGIAFLALDKDGDGAITSGRELFGDWTPDHADLGLVNGFNHLSWWDDSGDGFIDADDSVWTRLLLWEDNNHDGVSQAEEISRVADSGLLWLDTHYRETRREDRHGNALRYVSQLRWIDGRREKYFDVFFQRVE